MLITNKIVLTEFSRKHADTVKPLNKWIETIEDSVLTNHNELKALFPSVDYVGNSRYVFNLKGNNYRLVVLVIFFGGFVEIRFTGTHAEYDKIKDIENI
ncbi:MAG: type II toxin-antitoxin system HigB family toxin [Flavobacteriaceae bacterium]